MNRVPQMTLGRNHPIRSAELTLFAKKVLLGLLLLWTAGTCVHAQINASATFSSQPAGLNFDYTLTLNNNSPPSTPIETFWFGWVPGEDFLTTSPISVQPPSGWTDTITGGGLNDGFAIEFVTSTAPLNPGSSLTFQFQTADSPAAVAGDSPFYPTTPVGTSFVYQGSPFASPSESIVAQPVPEPSALTLLLLGSVPLAARLVGRIYPQLRTKN